MVFVKLSHVHRGSQLCFLEKCLMVNKAQSEGSNPTCHHCRLGEEGRQSTTEFSDDNSSFVVVDLAYEPGNQST